MMNESAEYRSDLHLVFVDFEKAFDSVQSSNNNSRDCRKIKSVKRDRLQAHEMSRINFHAGPMGSSCSYRKIFASSP